eukprot:g9015.t1
MIARPDKAARGGDDAFFVNVGDSGALDLGVFDGVGGWARRGHDPGVFTRGFAKAAAANIRAQRAEQAVLLQRTETKGGATSRFAEGVDLQQALEYATINAELAGTQGTCTACVVTFDPVYGMLNGLNVGDSGALLVRRDARGTPFVALRTATQRHKFNQPYQLGTGSRDKAHDAREFLFYVREGDVVVLATDGLLDNMYEADILRCIHEASEIDVEAKSPERPADLATALARRAFTLSRDKERLSPWEEEAVEAGLVPERGSVDSSTAGRRRQESGWNAGKWGLALERAIGAGLDSFRGASKESAQEGTSSMPEEDMTDFRGGKMDDITVVVATVRRSGSRNSNAAKDEGNVGQHGIRGEDGGTRVGLDAQGR